VTIDGERRATETARAPAEYLARSLRDGHALTLDEALTEEERRIEKFAMGLRTVDGVEADAGDLANLSPALETLAAEGFITRAGARIAATPNGRRLLNAVLERLFA
jgi:oxygen-independent coproporphyrinogen-3 oxidase